VAELAGGPGLLIAGEKITASHRARDAYVYVRQSTLLQVQVHTESLARQYDLRQRATALGWPAHQVVVIDEDLGRSGASTAGRPGFSELVADVGLGRAGIILALEVSRLARSNADWYQLLDLCALTDTLIADADGIYQPGSYNDRLILGLKGTMSEALCRIPDKASYADIPVMPTMRGSVWRAAVTGRAVRHNHSPSRNARMSSAGW